MSWFGDDTEEILASGADCIATGEDVDVEIADGVVVERRSVLWLSAAAVASVLAGGAGLRAARRQEPGVQDKPFTFGQFLAEAYPLAKKIVAADGEGEESYLMSVAAAMARLGDPGGEVRGEMRAFMQANRRDGERFPISAVQMRLQAGRGFAHHDHRDYNGIILGLQGEVAIRNFDILGDEPVPPAGKTFQIRQTRDDLILPGRFSTLARRRENVHELVAGPDGGRVLDVFTFFTRGARSYFMDVDPKPRDEKRRVYDAAWK